MYYTVYRITNLLNGMVYVGRHKTHRLDDHYFGSGPRIIKAIEEHGIDNFSREYLGVFDNEKDMYEMEAQVVDECFINRADTYNQTVGGPGCWGPEAKKASIKAQREKYGEDWAAVLGRRGGLKNKGKVGEVNSQFGTKWITDGISNKKIKGDIPEGWRRGRINAFIPS